jgi:hypothetical protein
MVHADWGFKPDAVEVPPFCEGKAHTRRVQARTIPHRCGKSRIDRCCSRKTLRLRMLSTGMWIAIMESRLRSFR